eukprot:SM000096S24888  [mRNA]  locus=s96:317224:320327:- [translate_table: standard]
MLRAWLQRLIANFGGSFILLIVCVYWTQGFRSFPWTGISFLIKDELKLSPSASQLLTSTAFMPWSIKPVYGMISDCVYIRGGRRVPYLIISSILSLATWCLLAFIPQATASAATFTALLTAQNVGSALADVVVDAMVAEIARKERAEFAGDLQSLSWFAMAVGGVAGSLTGGPALHALKAQGIFGVFALFPLVQLVACCWLDEKSLGQGKAALAKRMRAAGSTSHRRVAAHSCDASAAQDSSMPSLVQSTSEGHADTNGPVQVREEEEDDAKSVAHKKSAAHNGHEPNGKGPENGFAKQRRGSTKRLKDKDSVVHSEVKLNTDDRAKETSRRGQLRRTAVAIWHAVRQPRILGPLLWFMASSACIPSLGTMMFYFQTNHLKLDAHFLGSARVVGWAGLMLGTILYNRHLKKVSLRKIFMWVHIGMALLTMADTLLVSRINLKLGLPDKLFVLGASAFGDAVNQFKFMPFLVLSAQLCPPGIEGTLFAVFMSASNLGGNASGYLGACLASYLNIDGNHFEHMTIGVAIQAACTLLPIFFLFLIPACTTSVGDANGEAEDKEL